MSNSSNIDVGVGAKDNGYNSTILEIIQRNKELEEQMIKTKNAIESTNNAFSKSKELMKGYSSGVREVNGIRNTNNTSSKNNSTNENRSSSGNKTKKTSDVTLDLASAFGMNVSKLRNLTIASTKASDAFKVLGVASGTASVVVGGVAAGLVGMTIAGRQAYESNLKVYQGLKQLGGSINDSSLTESANRMISLKETWADIGLQLASMFTPIFEGLLELGVGLTSLLGIKGGESKVDVTSANGAGIISDFANSLNETRKTPVSQSIPILSNIASDAKQSGFSNDSAANLAVGTYAQALKLQEEFGYKASDVAKQLADAWMNGSDSAKAYGVVVDDNTLKGWLMQEKGIDAVNVKLSDAQMQAYRYELAMVQMGGHNSDAMQKNIKGWKEYGTMIESTKNQLFSFDKVITMTAMNFEIPEVGKQDTSIPGVTQGGTNNSNDKDKNKTPIVIDSNIDDINKQAQSLNKELSKLSIKNTVGIGESELVYANGLVASLNRELGLARSGITIGVDATQLGYAGGLATSLNNNLGLARNGITIGVDSTQLDLANQKAQQLFTSLRSIPMGNTVESKVGSTVASKSQTVGVPVDNKVSSGNILQKGAQGILNGLQKASDWLVNSGISGKASELNSTLLSKDMQKKYGMASVGTLAAPIVGAAGATVASGIASKIPDIFGLLGNSLGGMRPSIGYANGGISTKEKVANLSEGGRTEAVIPLGSSSANPALKQIAQGISEYGDGGGANYNINIHLGENGVIVDSNQAVKKLSSAVYTEITKIERGRGNMNYGRG